MDNTKTKKKAPRAGLLEKLQAHPKTVVLCCGLLMLAAAAASLCFGAASLTLGDLWQALCGNASSAATRIYTYVRLPRMVATLLAGSALSVAGLVIQSVLDNPLAGPNIIGVNSGAGLAVAACYAFLPSMAGLVPLAAFLGALFAIVLVYLIGRATKASRITIVLAGVAVSSILSAGIDTIITLVPDALTGSTAFRIGGVSGVTMQALFPQGWFILAALAGVFLLRNEMDVLALGEETARSLGMRVPFYRFALLFLAAGLAGLAVSFSGLLGFVGLLVPHMARRFVGYENRYLIPLCAFLGAGFLTLCDVLARVLFSPFELPVGLILSMLGGPFFLWLLVRQKRGTRHG